MDYDIRFANVFLSTYDSSVYWLYYETNRNYGYELVDINSYSCFNDYQILKIINGSNTLKKLLTYKRNISICSHYLQSLIKDCISTPNDMVFVEYDNENFLKRSKDKGFLKELEEEVEKLGLNEYIRFNEDDCFITVYGGIIQQFLFYKEKI